MPATDLPETVDFCHPSAVPLAMIKFAGGFANAKMEDKR